MLLGVASGDRPVEYPLFGRDFHARGTAFREGVETLRAAWRGGPLELPRSGLGADRELEVLPKPVHTTGIPIAIAGGAQQTPEWIAEHADASLNYPRPLDALRLKVHEWRQVTEDSGKPYLTPMVLSLQADADAPARPKAGLDRPSRRRARQGTVPGSPRSSATCWKTGHRARG
jgi:alkanesulfonate monooxygenase SsuD/methylene tetrahydromethanopterin reductase-like flavin-dependent oxidoreductase (luciferase family)